MDLELSCLISHQIKCMNLLSKDTDAGAGFLLTKVPSFTSESYLAPGKTASEHARSSTEA